MGSSLYVDKKLREAKYKLFEDGTYFGEIPGLNGVWANAKNLEDCRDELREVLKDWLLLKVRDSESAPGFNLEIKIDKRELIRNA